MFQALVDTDPTAIAFGDRRKCVPGYLRNHSCVGKKKVIMFLLNKPCALKEES